MGKTSLCTHVQKLRTELFWAIMQRVVVLSCRGFGSTCRSHRRGQESKISTQNMGPIGCPETSTRNYHYSLRNDPEEHISHLLRGGSLPGYYAILIGKITKISTESRAFIFSVKQKKKYEVNMVLEMLASEDESTNKFWNVGNSLETVSKYEPAGSGKQILKKNMTPKLQNINPPPKKKKS